MRCIVGLGNPEKKYFSTRHNIGFEILDQFAEKNKLVFKASKFDYYYSEGLIESSDFFLLKPTTYMNASGIAVVDFTNYNNLELHDLLVIADDVNLPPGQIRVRKSGSDGGHNGLKSIIYQLQNDQFPRLRFGIGSDFEKGEMADYVLSKFEVKDEKTIKESKIFAVNLIEQFIIGGFKTMMDHFSRFYIPINAENPTKLNDSDKN